MQKYTLIVMVCCALGFMSMDVAAQQNPCNPSSGKVVVKSRNPQNPCNPCGGKTAMKSGKGTKIAVNPCFAKHGTTFYISDPRGRNSVSFTSEAPLEDIVGTTTQIDGYIVFDPKNPSQGLRGELKVPVQSLKTGIPMRDGHLVSAQWLDAEQYPYITFAIEQSSNVRTVKTGEGFETWEMTLSGPFTLHGKTQNVNVSARGTFMKESEKTKARMPGDLILGRANFELALKDFGITGPSGAAIVGSKVGETIALEIRFAASSENSPMASGRRRGGKTTD